MEAARRNRARILASRAAHGPAARYDDTALEARDAEGPPAPSSPTVRPDGPGAGPSPDEGGEREFREGAPPDAEERVSSEGLTPEEARRRESEIEERLLDIEAALNRMGASGLPYAPRNPNAFGSALDLPRLRAEQAQLGEELAKLRAARERSPG